MSWTAADTRSSSESRTAAAIPVTAAGPALGGSILASWHPAPLLRNHAPGRRPIPPPTACCRRDMGAGRGGPGSVARPAPAGYQVNLYLSWLVITLAPNLVMTRMSTVPAACGGVITMILVPDFTVKRPAMLPNCTAMVPVKLAPVI